MVKHVLSGRIERVRGLSSITRQQMFALMQQYYVDVEWAGFSRDLDEKEWVVLVGEQATGQIKGFSTLMQYATQMHDQMVAVLFSGDTILDRAYWWGDLTLQRLWAQHAFDRAAAIADARPGMPVYWFLICSGYKTYRILPVCFRVFYPTYDQPTPPPLQELLDRVAAAKFGPRYDRERGIVHLDYATPLRAGVADITPQRQRDPHVAFFMHANPGHTSGDELACLTALTVDNLTAAGRRVLGRG